MPNVDVTTYEYQERQNCIDKMDSILEGLPSYVSRFLYNKLNAGRHLQPRTALAYAYDINLFFYYLSIANPLCKNLDIKDISAEHILGNLTIDDIEDYFIWLGQYERNGKTYRNGPAAQKRKISSISAMYRYLQKKQYVSSNPCSLMDFERLDEKPIIALTDHQQTQFLESLYNPTKGDVKITTRSKKIKDNYTTLRDLAVAYMFLGTGMRVSELVAINLNDINISEHYVYITRKGGKSQRLFFNYEVTEVLNDYLNHSRPKMLPPELSPDYDALFLSLHHKRISVRQIENIIKQAAERALGKSEASKISCHKLRSTFGTRLLKGSNSIALVAEVLGHSDISTTKRRYSAVQGLDEAPNYVRIMPE